MGTLKSTGFIKSLYADRGLGTNTLSPCLKKEKQLPKIKGDGATATVQGFHLHLDVMSHDHITPRKLPMAV